MNGWISVYNAQGMEAEFWRVFQDREFATDRFSGWRFEGMHRLEAGDELTIFAPDKNILWSGIIETKRVGLLSLGKIYPSDPRWCPPEIKSDDWEKWFQQYPPLEAILKTDRSGQKNQENSAVSCSAVS